jgi:AbrB family looped-hinge helix DNA binding protein
MTTIVSSKGQAVIPKHVRKALGIVPGARIDFIVEGETARIVPVRTGASASVEDGFGMLKYKGVPVSAEDMDVSRILARKSRK